MTKRALCLGLLLAGLSSSGCATLLSPYGGGYRPFRGMRPHTHAVVDPAVAARGRWDQVMRLQRGAIVDVLTFDGVAHVGAILGTNADTVRVLVDRREEPIARADVVRVDLVDLPGSEAAAVTKGAAVGAALGIGVSALFGGVIGGELWPPPGPLVRAGAAMGGVSGAQGALATRRGRLIYLAEDQRPAPQPPVRYDEPGRETGPQPWSRILPGVPRSVAGPSSAPIVQLGLPTLAFGGAQQILRFEEPSVLAMPSPTGGPPPALSQRPLVVGSGRGGPAICHSFGVPVTRR